MPRPHRIDATEMVAFLDAHYVEYASATTADGTQRKSIGRQGTGHYVVSRRYLSVAAQEDGPQVVYVGTDANEAVRLYNGLG